MANTFIISDLHFSQESMCKFTKDDGTKLRPYANAQEMDEALIANWNSVVREQDKVYALGDMAMKNKDLAIMSKLNGQKRLIRGNHDLCKTKDYLKYFKEIYAQRVLADMILSHYPIHPHSMTRRYKTCVHGHTHSRDIMDESGVPDSRYFNVSVEKINFTPIAIEDLRILIAEKQRTYPPKYHMAPVGD